MKPSTKFLALVVVALGVGLALYFGTSCLCARQIAGKDDLTWLRREFRLSDAEMAKIRELHEGYLPKCRENCGRIAEKQTEVQTAIAEAVTGPAVEQKLVELGTLKAQCEAKMLRHFDEVSRAMPPEQRKRYLAEMERMTLGFHDKPQESVEHSAAGNRME